MSIYKFWVYKVMSRPEVDESLKQNLRWFWPRIKEEVRETKSEQGSERMDMLS